jgi:hypothetical protein
MRGETVCDSNVRKYLALSVFLFALVIIIAAPHPVVAGSATNAPALIGPGAELPVFTETELAELAKLPPDKLRGKLAEMDEKIKQADAASGDGREKLLAMRDAALKTNETVRAIGKEIETLREKIDKTISDVPGIKQQADALKALEKQIMDLGRKKVRLTQLIMEVEQKAKMPDANTEKK